MFELFKKKWSYVLPRLNVSFNNNFQKGSKCFLLKWWGSRFVLRISKSWFGNRYFFNCSNYYYWFGGLRCQPLVIVRGILRLYRMRVSVDEWGLVTILLLLLTTQNFLFIILVQLHEHSAMITLQQHSATKHSILYTNSI